MSFPASLTTRTVKGRFVTFPDGKPSAGFVRIILQNTMQGPTDNAFVVPFDVTINFDSNGEIAVLLPATNDPQWSASFYKISISTEIAQKRNAVGSFEPIYKTQNYRLEVPYNSTGDLELADVLNVGLPQPGELYVVRSLLGAPNGVATLGSDGKITPSQLPIGQGGSVHWDEIEDVPATFPTDPPAWTDVTGKPSIFPAAAPAWTDVTGKPSTFPSTPAWTDVTGKPSTFPPAGHSHQTSDVTGLDTALSNKASESELSAGLASKSDITHTHDFAAITGKPATYPHDPIDWDDVQNKPDLSGGGSIAWNAVTSKPSTFPPSAHVHTESDVTGLATSLAGKSDTGHTHTESDISGLTADLAGKAATVHTHAQTDITGLSSALSAKADSSSVTTSLASKADLVGGVIPTAQLPAIAVIEFLGDVSSQSAMLALTGQKGDWCLRTDLGQHWIITGNDSTQLASWKAIPLPTVPVQSVNSQTGSVVLGKADVGLGNVDNTSDANKPVSTAQTTALALKAPLASPTFTGTVSGVTAAMVGLGNVNNTADSAKPVSTAQQTALDAKAPLASPTFTGTVSGVTAAMVGLGSVNNTADSAKPVSTAQQTALDLKANLASPALTGSPTAPTQTNGDNSTKIATTAYVATAVAGVTGGSGPATVTQVTVWNSSGATIAAGAPVYASGVDATSGYPTVALASATGILAAAFLGIAPSAIANGASGTVVTAGVVTGLNTSAVAAGSPIYLTTTAGVLSASPATSANFRIQVGVVLASSTTVGTILVRPSGQVNLGYGTANQVLGMNTGAGGQEYKTINGTANQITVTHAVNAITFSIPSNAALPGAPTTTTPTAADSTTKIATTAFVTTADNLKANIASPTFTGVPAAPTATAGTNTTQLATTAFVTAAVAADTPKILVLSAAASVPGGTPTGTIIIRTAT